MADGRPDVPARGRRYTTDTMWLAKQMFEGGWSIHAIRKYLVKQYGSAPTYKTVMMWVDEERYEKQLAAERRCRAERKYRDIVFWLHDDFGLDAQQIAEILDRFNCTRMARTDMVKMLLDRPLPEHEEAA